MRTNVVQKAVVFSEQGDVLMLRRSKTDIRRPLQWDLPGGLHEEGEELLASVMREIKEETGLRAYNPSPVYAITKVRKWKNKENDHMDNVVYIFYIAKTKSTDVELSHEHDKSRWMPITDALKEFEYELHSDLLQHIIDNNLAEDS